MNTPDALRAGQGQPAAGRARRAGLAGDPARLQRLGYDGLITVIESGWSADRREEVARHAADCIRR